MKCAFAFRLLAMLPAALVACLTVCPGHAARASDSEDLGKELLIATARPVYLRHCATCHGVNGDGKGPSAKFLAAMPRDFTRGMYKFRMTLSGEMVRVEDVYRTISMGVLDTSMPPWREVLTPDQRMLLARYVLTLDPEYDASEESETIEIPEEPPNDADSVARGKKVFELMRCGVCHGVSGRGDGEAAKDMVDSWQNPIRPADLTKPYVKGGKGSTVVYRAIATGLVGSPMPAYADSATPEQLWDLVHYVRSLARPRGIFDYLFTDPAGRMTTP